MRSVLVSSTGVRPEPSKSGRRSKSTPVPVHTQRLDIQGLRMVAVMLVVLSHLFHWPQGGFIGVDVFFVISGFLITGSLLHTLEKTGRISFSSFYRRRVRRIVPAATLVLVMTMVAAYFIFTGSRFKSTVWDAVAAFFFVSNWRFGVEGTDYFNSSGPVSALQHYWSLSVEEQFYFVWPAVILAIGVVATRKAWSKRTRVGISAGVMGVVVLASFIYSVLDTASNPTWAYFSTLTRVWELGVGALLAITISWFERIPSVARPFIAWAGLGLIAVGAFAITETGGGFPAPWAAVPVLGSALVIGAGVAGNHRFLGLLTNRYSTYVGDISYSLYLWHWPVIILLSALMDRDGYYFAASLFLMFGLSIAAYHFFEDPIRQSDWLLTGAERRDRRFLDISRWRLRPIKMSDRNKSIGIGSLALVTAGVSAYAFVPTTVVVPPTPSSTTTFAQASSVQQIGPAQTALVEQIKSAVQATEWPDLSPTMDEAIAGPQAPSDILPCGSVDRPDPNQCTWGSPTAPHTMLLAGDSIAMTYAGPLRKFAEGSNGQWKLRVEGMFGCSFVDITMREAGDKIGNACPDHKKAVVETINEVRPDVVVISNRASTHKATEWNSAMTRLTSQFAANTKRIIYVAAPPNDINIADCYTRVSRPSNCVGGVTDTWQARSDAESSLVASSKDKFIDSRNWFCTPDGRCPSFVGTTPVKRDGSHMTPAYGDLMAPAIAEAFAPQLEGL
ncbi:peptidoglycan/LPS O-acetylase OafA/YrhL [Rhodococcus sp. OK519]|uniref:acyltransferase family protein n=1 Tax=Rhodococcus sp. OK519 TaxID=2135729 RepID=UPI000D3D56B8|nr:peptidoglycan/LPS O-acetylase OafA/YrhL [Rhodococcus sp. OK519]